MVSSTLTSKGQITIPAKARAKGARTTYTLLNVEERHPEPQSRGHSGSPYTRRITDVAACRTLAPLVLRRRLTRGQKTPQRGFCLILWIAGRHLLERRPLGDRVSGRHEAGQRIDDVVLKGHAFPFGLTLQLRAKGLGKIESELAHR
jgi:hypothetical protein